MLFSQDTGAIEPQSDPAGQQMTALARVVFKGRHVVDAGQQKSDGKSAPQEERVLSVPQAEPCLGRRLREEAALRATASADVDGARCEIARMIAMFFILTIMLASYASVLLLLFIILIGNTKYSVLDEAVQRSRYGRRR